MKSVYDGPGEYEPIGMWGYFGYAILFSIPVIGWIIALIVALCAGNRNVKNLARSYFCLVVIALVAVAALAAIGLIDASYVAAGSQRNLGTTLLIVLFVLLIVLIVTNRTPREYPVPKEFKPIGMWGYFGYEILFMIPVIGWIVALIFALTERNRNLKNFAASQFCIAIILAVAAVIGYLMGFSSMI